MDQFLFSGNGCSDRAGKRGWVAMVTPVCRSFPGRYFSRTKSSIGFEMLGEATRGIHGSLVQKTIVHLPLAAAWSTVWGAFDALRTLLKKLPPDMLPHAMAVVSGSFRSQAFFDGQHHGQESLCWLLWQWWLPQCLPPNLELPILVRPSCHTWGCRAVSHIGWPSISDPKYDQVLHHLAAVRRARSSSDIPTISFGCFVLLALWSAAAQLQICEIYR